MLLQEARDLPADHPGLIVNEVPIPPYALDWRTGNARNVPPSEDLTQVGALNNVIEVRAVLQGSAVPSELTIGVYPAGLDEIDPRQPPPAYFNCVNDQDCTFEQVGGDIHVNLSHLYPAEASHAVFTMTASYFADIDGQPFSNSTTWAFEANR